MNKELLKLINNFKRSRKLISFDEAATKQAVILRILKVLGWDSYNIDEVYPEYSVGGKRVDYALRHNNRNKVFIEVKKSNEDLDKHQEQLLNYSFQEGVKLAILTNGISWWFYLPLREGNWEQRKFYTIEIYDQETEDIVRKFEEFLSKENVISDRAIENAESIYKSKQKEYLIKETLPKAWKKIITDPNEILIELLADTTEKLCGYKPDNKTIEQFLVKKIQFPVIQTKSKKPTNCLFYTPSEGYTEETIKNKYNKSLIYETLIEIIKNDRDMILDISNKYYIRFIPKSLDFIPKKGKGWIKSKRILLFEFQNKENLSLNLIIGPGAKEVREKIYNKVKEDVSLFNKSNRNLTLRWFTIYKKFFLKATEYKKKNIEEIRKTIKRKFKEFKNSDLPYIEKKIKELEIQIKEKK